MKIVHIIGGLGNQMFQFAFSLALKNNYIEDVIKIDINSYKNYKVHDGYLLDEAFNITPDFATESELKMFSRNIDNYTISRIIRRILPPKKTEYIEKMDYTFDSGVFNSDKIYYEGYWQHVSYLIGIEDSIKSFFKFNISPNDNTYSRISYIYERYQTVSIHVRRGDYIKAAKSRMICDLEYYKNAIEIIQKKKINIYFILFSDDIQWVKHFIVPLFKDDNYLCVDWNSGISSYKDMFLMSCCKDNIIANSSFSWWAAWLNSNSEKTVIAPKKWTNVVNTKDFSPVSWLKI